MIECSGCSYKDQFSCGSIQIICSIFTFLNNLNKGFQHKLQLSNAERWLLSFGLNVACVFKDEARTSVPISVRLPAAGVSHNECRLRKHWAHHVLSGCYPALCYPHCTSWDRTDSPPLLFNMLRTWIHLILAVRKKEKLYILV